MTASEASCLPAARAVVGCGPFAAPGPAEIDKHAHTVCVTPHGHGQGAQVRAAAGRVYRLEQNLWHDIDGSAAFDWPTLLALTGPVLAL